MTLPPAPAAFRWSAEVWGHALRATALDPHAQHLFTTRQLALHTPDKEAAWSLVAKAVGGDNGRLFRVTQVHGRSVRVVRELTRETVATRPDADAQVSNVAGVVLAVQVADCVPMLIVDPRRGAVAAVHAGWRGTAAGITAETIATLEREYGCDPADLRVAVGPSIGACCYQVGAELIDAFHAGGASATDTARWFSPMLRLDLWAATYDLLLAAGVRAEHIHMSRLCTQSHADIFDSYRAAGPRAGRMIAAIAVPHASGAE